MDDKTFQGYKGRALDILKKYDVHVWDKAEVETTRGHFSGKILPRAENTFGYFRRLIILPYKVTIPPEEVDRQLTSKLRQELSGILNWVLAYLPGLMNRGEFTSSVSCEKALDQYRLQSDNVRLFVSEQCEQSEYTTIASEVYTAYRNYCIGSSLKPIGKQKFYERLESLGFSREMYANAVYFKLKVNAV